MQRIEQILRFWFGDRPDDGEAVRRHVKLWFTARAETDQYVREHFEADLKQASAGSLTEWEQTPRGRLALIVLSDQFPRNIYRGTARAFAYDSHAQRLCLDGQACGHDKMLRAIERSIFYMPLQHAEELALQEQAVGCFSELVEEAPSALKDVFVVFRDYAVAHRDIVARFGRFPHRNAILGRVSSPEEIAFLQQPGSSF